jgi:GR25 family glycosyltransferase involved in LPS biosynthesis
MPLQDIRTCPTYVINLDRRPDRWEKFSKQPTLREFPALKRFSAVDGSKLDVETDKRISLHTRQNIRRRYRRSDYEINTAGAIGASLSHFTIWKQLLDSDAEYVVVFEDDTIVDEKTMTLVDKLIPTLPKDGWDMWLLGTHAWAFSGVPLTPDKKGWWKVRNFTGAHAYVLSRRGAEILLQENFPIETHVEYYISACTEMKGLRVIRHASLRVTYFAEAEEGDDSDTFDTRLSCPVCLVPDNYLFTGMFMTRTQIHRAAIGALAAGFIGYGVYLGMKKLRGRTT